MSVNLWYGYDGLFNHTHMTYVYLQVCWLRKTSEAINVAQKTDSVHNVHVVCHMSWFRIFVCHTLHYKSRASFLFFSSECGNHIIWTSVHKFSFFNVIMHLFSQQFRGHGSWVPMIKMSIYLLWFWHLFGLFWPFLSSRPEIYHWSLVKKMWPISVRATI